MNSVYIKRAYLNSLPREHETKMSELFPLSLMRATLCRLGGNTPQAARAM